MFECWRSRHLSCVGCAESGEWCEMLAEGAPATNWEWREMWGLRLTHSDLGLTLSPSAPSLLPPPSHHHYHNYTSPLSSCSILCWPWNSSKQTRGGEWGYSGSGWFSFEKFPLTGVPAGFQSRRAYSILKLSGPTVQDVGQLGWTDDSWRGWGGGGEGRGARLSMVLAIWSFPCDA